MLEIACKISGWCKVSPERVSRFSNSVLLVGTVLNRTKHILLLANLLDYPSVFTCTWRVCQNRDVSAKILQCRNPYGPIKFPPRGKRRKCPLCLHSNGRVRLAELVLVHGSSQWTWLDFPTSSTPTSMKGVCCNSFDFIGSSFISDLCGSRY